MNPHDPLNPVSLRDHAHVQMTHDQIAVVITRPHRRHPRRGYLNPSPSSRLRVRRLVRGRFWTTRGRTRAVEAVFSWIPPAHWEEDIS